MPPVHLCTIDHFSKRIRRTISLNNPKKFFGETSRRALGTGIRCPFSMLAISRAKSREKESTRCGLDLLPKVGTQRERAVIVQLLVASPPHRIKHSLDLNLRSKFQSFPIGDAGKHELCLPNLAG